MNFFTDLEKTIDNAGRTIASKASSLADSSKLSFQISSEEKALTDLYRQLGSAYHTHFGSAPDEKLAPLCASITQKLELLSSLKAQELTARGKRLCPNCGSECDIYQPFCYVCRAELSRAAAPGMQICPSCGKEIPQDHRFCVHCGSPVATGK